MASAVPLPLEEFLNACRSFASSPEDTTSIKRISQMTGALESAHKRARTTSAHAIRNLNNHVRSGGEAVSPGGTMSPAILAPPSGGMKRSPSDAAIRQRASTSIPKRPVAGRRGRQHAQTALAGSLSAAQKELMEETALRDASAWLEQVQSVQSGVYSMRRRQHKASTIQLQVLFVFGEGEVTQEVTVADMPVRATVAEAKERAMALLNELGMGASMDFSETRMFSVGSSAANEEPMTLWSLAAVRNAIVRARKLNTEPVVRFFVLRKQLIREEKFATMQIGSLIGIPLQFFDGANDEVSSFRGNMKRLRSELSGASRLITHAIVANVSDTEELPPDFPDELIFRFRFSDDVVKTAKVASNVTPLAALTTVFEKFRSNLAVLLQTAAESFAADEYALKVPGEWDFLIGESRLCDYEYIRKIGPSKGTFIPINVVARASVPELSQNPDLTMEPHFPEPEHQVSNLYHDDIAVNDLVVPEVAQPFISLWDVDDVVSVEILGIDSVVPSLITWHWSKEHRKPKMEGVAVSMFVEVGLFHGQQELCPSVTTRVLEAHECSNNSPRFFETLRLTTQLAFLPKAARLCITVWGQKKKSLDLSSESDNNYPLGWTSLQLVDFRNQLIAGKHSYRLWQFDPANPIGPTSDNPASDAPTLHLSFPRRIHPVVFPEFPPSRPLMADEIIPVPAEDQVIINAVVARDPLAEITAAEKAILWDARYSLIHNPRALPKFLLAVKWDDPSQVEDTHRLLELWAPLDPVDSLELLDANYFDARVRSFAIDCLAPISDEMLEDFLLQLVQVLKYEPHHDSDLARFLLIRALQNRRIGHSFFWILKSEVEEPDVTVRFSLLLEAYLRGCGAHRDALIKQNDLLTHLIRAAEAIKEVKDPQRLELLRGMLSQIPFPDGHTQILLNPKWAAHSLKIEKCKYMDSKKLPLWLVFENEDDSGDDLYVIFKAGDDLRQDKLTLQLFAIMDKVWEADGLPLRLEPYSCVATGPELGMIEVVRHANTLANIQYDYGGASSVFKEEPLAEWLKGKCKDDHAYSQAVEVFKLSCAAYCVATFVLGIGDRHNDNIMMQENGRLFHIDFGHFLGNIKRKLGIKRERTPFILTPDMAYIMGGKDSEGFAEFVDIACTAYISLRRKASLFINLMMLMVSTGIPELKSTKDLEYLRDALALDKATEEEARADFERMISYSLDHSRSTALNWGIHIAKHRGL